MYRTSTPCALRFSYSAFADFDGCVHQTKLDCESIASKPSERSPAVSRPRVASTLARFAASQAWSSMAAVAPAIDSESQLYESFTLISCSMRCGCAKRKPNRRPARAYDLLSERE